MDTSAISDGSIYLSVVAPAYNEAENLPRLFSEIATALSPLDQPWEIICVDDGSVDDTPGLVPGLMKKHPQLRVVSLRNRSGQTAALDAGLRCARGTFIATLDADLQNDPADIPRLLEVLLSKQCGLVNGRRTHRRDPWVRLVSTRFANNAWKWLMHERVHDSGCGLKVFRRECIDRLKLFNGMHRFLPALVKMEGYEVVEVPVNHRPRTAGKTKYGVLNRVFRAFHDCLAIRWMQRRMLRYECREWKS